MTQAAPIASSRALPVSPEVADTLQNLGFDQLPLAPATLLNLQQLGYLRMTPIQAAALPVALAGHDLIAQAKTGSGKTAAFALSLLARLNPRRFAVQALVLCPTRELADQVTQEIRRMARGADNIKVLTLCGGSTMRPQISSLEHGAHVVVGTPGRIMDHLQRGSLDLAALDTLVLDEADRMLDMGFFDDIVVVAKACPKQRQTLLFSATYPEGIASLSRQFLRQPQQITLTEQHDAGKIRQRFYEVAPDQKLAAVGMLLKHYRPVSTLAFCNTRQQCRDLLQVLRADGFVALALHGELARHEAPWAAALEPLALAFAARFHDFLPKLTYPLRVGTHFNISFALLLARHWAEARDADLVALIDTRVNEQTRAVTARAEIPNPGARIRPGMAVRVAVQQGQRRAQPVMRLRNQQIAHALSGGRHRQAHERLGRTGARSSRPAGTSPAIPSSSKCARCPPR